jgi:hypothetical protein
MLERYGEVTVAQTVQPKAFHSLTRGATLPILLETGATPNQVAVARKLLEDELTAAVRGALDEALRIGYGKTLEQVTRQ